MWWLIAVFVLLVFYTCGNVRTKSDTPALEVIVLSALRWVRPSFSLAAVSCSSLLGRASALFQHQYTFPMLLQSHRVSLHILKNELHKHHWWPRQVRISVDLNMRCRQTNTYLALPANTLYIYVCLHCLSKMPKSRTYSSHIVRHTFRMRMKSCLSTRRKWQLSSLKIIVAARGASFSNASCPKSSPSCSVVTSPYRQTVVFSITTSYETDLRFICFLWTQWSLPFRA